MKQEHKQLIRFLALDCSFLIRLCFIAPPLYSLANEKWDYKVYGYCWSIVWLDLLFTSGLWQSVYILWLLLSEAVFIEH